MGVTAVRSRVLASERRERGPVTVWIQRSCVSWQSLLSWSLFPSASLQQCLASAALDGNRTHVGSKALTTSSAFRTREFLGSLRSGALKRS